MLAQFFTLIVWSCDIFFSPSVLAAKVILFPFKLFTAVFLIYSMSQLEAHQAAVLKKFKQWQCVETFVCVIKDVFIVVQNKTTFLVFFTVKRMKLQHKML